MTSEATDQLILKKLDEIKSELDYIKSRMSKSYVLHDDDIESLDEAEKDLAEGKTQRL